MLLLSSACVVFFLSSPASATPRLAPFTSDGCSAFPDGTIEDNTLFLNCCTAHDFAYWQGGTKAQRQAADEDFKVCISELGYPELAEMMYLGVRVGGSPHIPTPFRWGYGWPFPRDYRALSIEERILVGQLTPIPFRSHAQF